MQKILPISRVIMRRVHWILKIRRRKWLLRMALKLKASIESENGNEIRRQSGNRKKWP